MARYEITSPDGHRYEVSAPDNASEAEVMSYAQQQFSNQPAKVEQPSGIGLGVRNMIQGAMALPNAVSNAAYGAYNLGADAIQGKNQGFRFKNQNENLADLLTKAGFPEPQNKQQDFAGAIIQGATGGLAGAGAAQPLSRMASPAMQRMASILGADAPVRNTLAGAAVPVGMQMAADEGASGPMQMAAGIAAGAATGGGPAAVSAGARGAGRATRAALASRFAEPLGEQEARLVLQAEQMGLPLRPGQYSGSNFMRQGDAVMADTPWPHVSGFRENDQTRVLPAQQTDQYNRMLSHQFGEDAPRITDDVMRNASDRIGRVYEDVLPRTTVRMDNDLSAAMAAIDDRISEALPAMKPEDANRISGVMNRMRGLLAGNGVDGRLYQTYRARGGLLDEMSGSQSPVLSGAARDMRSALDDAFARQAQGDDGALLRGARAQYRALQTLKPLADKAPSGNISPGLVLGQVIKEYGSPSNAGELGTLAQVGNAFLKAQPSSGTAERSIWRSLMNSPFSEGIPALANQGMSLPVSAFATRTLNRAVNSPEMRTQLLARALAAQPIAAAPAANNPDLLAALLSNRTP